jgi:hypothetical protein
VFFLFSLIRGPPDKLAEAPVSNEPLFKTFRGALYTSNEKRKPENTGKGFIQPGLE